MYLVGAIFWDPNPIAFTVPLVNHPILWYSLFFALGFFLAYTFVHQRLIKEGIARPVLDAMTWYLFFGMLLGARLGHVLFYEWSYFQAHPHKIFLTWEGGLASHGAAIGILLALWLFWRKYKPSTFLKLLDLVCVAVAIAAGFIRVGNGFNQEILGVPSNLPWAVFFGHPADPYSTQPCHPVQFYEAAFYFITAIGLWIASLRKNCTPGSIAGSFFVLIFTFRLAIDSLKLPQASVEPDFLYMGQLLSIPFILLGLFLFFRSQTPTKTCR